MEGTNEHQVPTGHVQLLEVTKARDYHFMNMHVYVNPIFCNYDPAKIKLHISQGHHVHIYMWNANVTEENLEFMMSFIKLVNGITGRPVYVHTPKRGIRITAILAAMLKMYKYNDEPLKYKLIVEKNSNITEFNHGNFIPVDGTMYSHYFRDARLLISWDFHEYARPTFYSVSEKITKQVFKD